MPTQYIGDQTTAREDIIGRLNQNMLAEHLRKQQLQDAIKRTIVSNVLSGKMKAKKGTSIDMNAIGRGDIPDLNNLEPAALGKANTSISISQRPYSEITKAQEIVNTTPEQYLKAGMATGGQRQWGSGFMGLPFGRGSKRSPIVLSDAAKQEQEMAKSILGNPYKVTKRITGQGDINVDESISDTESGLPDPLEYEEGTVIETDDGTQYQLVGGEWQLKS